MWQSKVPREVCYAIKNPLKAHIDDYYGLYGIRIDLSDGSSLSLGDIASPEDLYQYIEKCEGGFQCSICSKVFTRRYEGRSHCESVHFPNYFEYQCEVCGESFKSKKTYFNHKQYNHRTN